MRKWDKRVQQLAQRELAQAPLPIGGIRESERSADGGQRFARLLGRLYEEGSTAARRRLLEELLRPMSTFALIGVANGLFARIKARSAEWQPFQLRDEDIAMVDTRDVVALVEHAVAGNAHTTATLTATVRNTAELAHLAAAHALPMQVPSTAAPATQDPAMSSR